MKKFFFWVCVLWVALFLLSWLQSPLQNLLNALLSGLLPVIIGIVVAYFVNHAVSFYEKIFLPLFKKVTTGRFLSVILGVLSSIIVVAGVLFLCVPALIENLNNFTVNLPEYFEKIKVLAQNIDQFLGIDASFSLYSLVSSFDLSAVDSYAKGFTDSAINLLSPLSVGLLLSVLILVEKNAIFSALNKLTDRIFPSPARIKEGVNCTLVILDGYVYGKVIEGLLTGVIFSIFYYIVGLPYSLLFAFIMAVFFIIPYVGGYVALLPAFLVALDLSISTALWVLFVGVILLNILGSFISPIIFKNKLKLSALTITASIIVGGGAFGVLGFLLAPPIAATIKAYFSVFIKTKRHKRVQSIDKT